MGIDMKLIEKELEEREKILDMLIVETRTAVRFCANSIKCIHSKDKKGANENLKNAKKILDKVKKYRLNFKGHVDHVYQEYTEAAVLLHIIEKKDVPSFKKLGVPIIPYVLGLLDLVGELKREMYENLRKSNKKEAERFFHKMEWIFHELMHLKYSNSVLPDFRRKQDVARIQIEQARGELI